jgi:hypothetical protein
VYSDSRYKDSLGVLDAVASESAGTVITGTLPEVVRLPLKFYNIGGLLYLVLLSFEKLEH